MFARLPRPNDIQETPDLLILDKIGLQKYKFSAN